MKHLCLSCLLCLFGSTLLWGQSPADPTWEIEVAHPEAYDADFLSYWEYIKPHPIRFAQDSIVIDHDRDHPILIPSDIPLNQAVHYQCSTPDTLFDLVLTRVNYTNLEYSLVGKSGEKEVFSRKGIAKLEPTFYLGAEGVYEKNEDEVFGMVDYNIELNDQGEIKLMVPIGTLEVVDYLEVQEGGNLYLSCKLKEP